MDPSGPRDPNAPPPQTPEGDRPRPPEAPPAAQQGWQSQPPAAPPPQQNWQGQATPPPPPGGGSMAQAATLPPGPLPNTTVADFVTRLVAYVIDAVIIGIANFVVSMILFPLLIGVLGGLYVVIHALAILAISAGYFIYFWMTRRQTPGMIVMKLLIVEDGTGNTLTQSQAIKRWLYLGLPLALSTMLSAGSGFAGLGIGGLGGLFFLFTLATIAAVVSLVWQFYLAYTTYQDPRKQGVHDKAVNSVVVSYGPSPLGGMRS